MFSFLDKKLRKVKIKYIATIVLVVLIVMGALGFVTLKQNNKHKIDKKVIAKIYSSDDCKAGLQAAQNMRAARDNPNDSISLLSYRASCQIGLRQYKEALLTLEELKSYYINSNNKNNLLMINEEIADVNYAIQHPIKHVDHPKATEASRQQ